MQSNWLTGWAVRNESDFKYDANWANKVVYAQKHRFWHYHIGILDYEIANNGELVSEYILHYQRFDDRVHIVAMTYHPPFELPSENEIL